MMPAQGSIGVDGFDTVTQLPATFSAAQMQFALIKATTCAAFVVPN